MTTQSTWVTRAEENDLPSQGYRGDDTDNARVTYVNDGFDEDAPIGTQGDEPRVSQRLTMRVVRSNRPAVIVTYERGMPVLWERPA